MDKRLLQYYNKELQHLRGMSGEFAEQFPKIAGRLALDSLDCADPYVERLIESFAFLAARVHLKIDDEFPRFTQYILNTVYPHFLAPTPSMAIVEIFPDMDESALAEGFTLPRDTSLRSQMAQGDQTPCEYRTAHDLTLWPLTITEAKYFTKGLVSLDLPDIKGAKSALQVRLRVAKSMPFKALSLNELVFYLRGSGDTTARLYEQLFADAIAVIARPASRPIKWQHTLPVTSIRSVGFEDHQALLPVGPRSFQGYRLLSEYFDIPERFMFFEVGDLQTPVRRCEENEMDLFFMFDDMNVELEHNITAQSLALYCTPAINLFPKRADRIHVSDRFWEFHVVPDRTRPTDFEVMQVNEVEGFGSRGTGEQIFKPFYAASDLDHDDQAYFAVHRAPRVEQAKRVRTARKSTYTGSEVFLSLVDALEAPYHPDLKQLAVTTMCTNRDLPLRMPVGSGKTDFTMKTGAPVESIRVVYGPTAPKPASASGEIPWRILSHLTLNYLSLIDTDEQDGAAGLRTLLELYGDTSSPTIRRQIDGVRSINSRPITRRVVDSHPIAFARGLEINLTFDETAFEGTGVFMLGAVLERFFSRYVSINSLTETVIHTQQRGEIKRWPTQTGKRRII